MGLSRQEYWSGLPLPSLRDLWDNIKHANIGITGVPEEKEKRKGYEKFFEEIIVEKIQGCERLLEPILVSYKTIIMPLWEKAMAPHSSTLAWKIPWAEEPGRLQSRGSLRVGHD